MIDSHGSLGLVRQCQLMSVSRSSYYFTGKGESHLNLSLMRLIDEQFMETPWYGSRQMARWLKREGYRTNRKRVRRLMKKMGLHSIYQKPRTTIPHPDHKIYPYLLQEIAIDRPNQVWCSDITYSAPSPWRRWERRRQGLSMPGIHKDSYMEGMNRMSAFRYGKARAEAEVICRALAE